MKTKTSKQQLGSGFLHTTPLYHRVYSNLREKLVDGVFVNGTPLPSEPKLALQYEVSRVTVRRAMAQLEADGLVTRRPGSGTYAKTAKLALADKENLVGWLDPVLSASDGTRARELSLGRVLAPARVASALNLSEGDEVLRIERVRIRGNEPLIYTIIFIPSDLADMFEGGKLDDRPTAAIFTDSGIALTKVDQVISAVTCDEVSARILRLAMGVPLILVKRILRSKKDRPVQYFESYYRPDKFEYRQTMKRVQPGRKHDAVQWLTLR
jgi:GntR family transcriptional regulator